MMWLELFLIATYLFTVLTQSKNHYFISLSYTSTFLTLSLEDSRFELANEPNLPSLF